METEENRKKADEHLQTCKDCWEFDRCQIFWRILEGIEQLDLKLNDDHRMGDSLK